MRGRDITSKSIAEHLIESFYTSKIHAAKPLRRAAYLLHESLHTNTTVNVSEFMSRR